MKPAELSVRFPSLMAVTVVIVIAWGAVSLVTLPREEDPALTWRLANIVTRLPGASPERVESLITDVLERHVEEVDAVEHVYSVSRAGVSLVQVELSDDVTAADPVWQKVRHKLAVAATELPPGIVGPELDDEIMGTFAALIAVTAPARSYRELKDTAQALEDRLRYLPMTASTDLFGTQQEVLQVEPDAAQLAAYGLSFRDVAAALAHRNTRRPSGRLQVAGGELLIEASGEFDAEDEVAGMILLSTPEGRTLHVRDVARVRRTTAQPPEPLVRWNGQRAVVVGARARRDVRIDVYGRQVAEIVRHFSQSLPADVRCTVAHDLAHYTTELTEQLSRTLLMSVAFVFLSTAVFMGWRAAGIITVAIPLTGLIALVCFSLIGIPLNQMSVMAMIMSMGLLVDDAIVVTEQIHRRAGEGVDVASAAAHEPSVLFLPLLVTTLTTMAAFLPIYLLPGGTGEFVRTIPVTITVCLLAALLVAVAVIPWLASQLLKAPSGEDGLHGRLARLAAPVTAGYMALLKCVVRRPLATVAIVVFAMTAIASLGLLLRRDFFSPVQRDQFVVDVFAPPGSSLNNTADVVRRVEEVLADEPHITSQIAFIGRNAPLVFYNLTSQETYANHYAQLIVRVSDWRQTAAVAQRIQTQLRANIADADTCAHILEHGAPFVAPFEIRIRGASLETLHALGRRAEALLNETPGVRNVRNNYGNQALKLIAHINEPVARSIGVDQDTVAEELRSRLDGLAAGDIQEGDERIDISVRLPTTDRDNVRDLRSVYFKPTPDTRLIPFATVATLTPAWEASSIYRRDGQRTLSVLAYPQFGLTAAQVSQRFLPRLATLTATLPRGYEIELGGEVEQRTEAESNLLGKAIYAVGLVLMLLLIEFRSIRLAGLIVAVIPLSLAGTMLGLWLTGWPLNFMAIMGMMILIGVMVNDAIIMIDGYQRRSLAGQPIEQVVIDGTLERMRHVVITSVTTIAGFLPLALSPSLLWPPLAIAIIGGLALSTILTLVALPAAYLLLASQQSS